MAPSKQTGIYWKMHYNKEFSFGLFFLHQNIRERALSLIVFQIYAQQQNPNDHNFCDAGLDPVSAHINVNWEQHH